MAQNDKCNPALDHIAVLHNLAATSPQSAPIYRLIGCMSEANYLGFVQFSTTTANNSVYQSIGYCIVGSHKIITISICSYFFQILARVMSQQTIEPITN